MLNFSRKPGQEIIINGDIIVRVIDKRTIGIEAPHEVSIHRAEVYERNTGKRLPENSREVGDIMSAEL